MNLINMPELRIGSKCAKKPIIQGGMGVGISLAGLASAVAAEGGIGIIAANAIGMIEPDYFQNSIAANVRALRREIRKAREATTGIIGVNLMIAANDFSPLMEVILEEKPDIVFMGAGLPIKGVPVKELRSSDIMIVPIVSSERAVKLIFKSWQKKFDDIPDAVVVEGPEAGGHLGFKECDLKNPDYRLELILPKVIETLKPFEEKYNRVIPVIAAGGIFSGADILKFFNIGASGVQLGSRFVTTNECDADIKFKETYINANKDDIVIIESPLGMPGRAINNKFIENINNKITIPTVSKCPWKCIEFCKIEKAGYCISIALNNARMGHLDEGYAFAGSNAYKATELTSVHSLMLQLEEEFLAAIKNDSKVLQ